MNDCWPSRSSSFLRSTLCSELWSWQGEGDRHTVATGNSACFDVETVVEIDGVKVGPTRSHVALRNMRIERSRSSQTTPASSDSSSSFGSSSEFELALVFEKPGRYTLPILDITRIRCKYLHQGKASIEARDSLFLFTAASQNELERLLEVARDVKAVKTLADSRLCTACKEKGELKKKKRKQKRELQQQQPPTDSEPTSWLDGEYQATKKQKLKVLECAFRRKSLPSLADTNQEPVYCIRDLLKSKEHGSRKHSKMGVPQFEGGDSLRIQSDEEVYNNSVSQEDLSSEHSSMFYDCERPEQLTFEDERGHLSPTLAVPNNSSSVVLKPPRVGQRKSSGKRNGREGLRAGEGAMEEKENLDVFADEDLNTIGDETLNKFAQRRGMNEVMRKVQEEQRRVKEEKRRKDERRKFDVDERRESEERAKMLQQKESLRKLLEQERQWKDDPETKRGVERRSKEEDDRKLKADEERLKKSLERRLHVENRLRKEETRREEDRRKEEERRKTFMAIRFQDEQKRRKDEESRSRKEEKRKEEEKKKEEERRKRLIETKLQEDEKRRKDEEDRRIKELKQREEERKLQEQQQLREQEQKLREHERNLHEQKLREEGMKLLEQKLRDEERKLHEQKLREEEQKLQEQRLREEERKLQEQKLREEERKVQEQKKREEQRKLQDHKLREEHKRVNEVERRLQELKQSEEQDKQFKEVLRRLQEQIEEQLQEQQKDEEKTQENMNLFKEEEDRQKLREHEELRKFQDSVKTTSRLSHRFRRSRVSAEARMSPKEIRKILEEQLDRLDPWKLDEEMKRWRSEEIDRLAKEDSWAMPDHDRSILEEQRKRAEEVMKMSQRLNRKPSQRVTDDAEARSAPGRTENIKGQTCASAEVNRAGESAEFQNKCSQDRTFLDHLFGSWGNPSLSFDSERLGKGRESFKPTETFLKPDRLRQEELRKAELERKKAEKSADEERKRLSQERMKAAKLEAKRLDKLLKEAQRRAKAEERQRQQQKAQEQSRQKTVTSSGFSRAHYLTYRQYEDAWNVLKTSGQKSPLAYSNIPWPPHNNPLFVEEGDSLAAQRRKLRIALLRWHPDKFQSLCGNRLSLFDKNTIEARAKTVAQEVIVWKSKLDNMS